MYRNDDSLPKLPLPDVKTTLGRLHLTLLPFNAAASAEALVAQAPALEAAQKVLQHRQATQANWLGDWWDEFAYLQARYPVVINSNIMAARLVDMDPATWKAKPLFANPVHRAALCIVESLHFRSLMLGEAVKELLNVSKPLCMNQFRRYFGMRVPQREKDTCVFQLPRDATHAIIMYKGRMGSIKVADAEDITFGLSFPELVACVQRIVTDIDAQAAASVANGAEWWLGQCVGALTAADRDTAADGFKLLMSASPRNKQYLDRLFSSCLTVISIDDDPVWDVTDGLLHAAHGSPHNRWFDRATSQIVASNGVGMYQGEHSPMDAIVSATTPIELVSLFGLQYFKEKRHVGQSVRANFPIETLVEVFAFSVPTPCQDIIRKTIQGHNAFAASCEVTGYRFTGYGRSFLASKKIGPDFVVQAALQLALLEDSGSCAATYESASTRMFQQGRTETIRAHSLEQKNFVEALQRASVAEAVSKGDITTLQKLGKLLVAAMRRHGALSAEASTGNGVDRHLMGIRIASAAIGKELPPFFKQPDVEAASNFVLLTSQMIGTTYLGGFAHSLPYGYGCCYYIHQDQICIVVSCNSVAKKTSVKRFCGHLTKAFEKIGELVKTFPAPTAAPKSSL